MLDTVQIFPVDWPVSDKPDETSAANWDAAGRRIAAAIIYGPEDDPDAAIAAAVGAMSRAGMKVAGLLQRFGERISAGKREMFLEVLPSGTMIRLNDPRGPGVQGCILDTDALARAAIAFREAAFTSPDILVASRFGKEEAAGGGMRAELAQALMAGTPLLVPVKRNLLPAWRDFLGEPGLELPPDRDAILTWARGFVGVPAF